MPNIFVSLSFSIFQNCLDSKLANTQNVSYCGYVAIYETKCALPRHENFRNVLFCLNVKQLLLCRKGWSIREVMYFRQKLYSEKYCSKTIR